MKTSLPRVFVASSQESLDVAYALQEGLEYDAEVTVWTQNVFRPTKTTLIELAEVTRRFDYAAFVFSPDDAAMMRGAQLAVVRDNVLFEFGLFAGALGVDRCFFVVPRDTGALHLPSDLLGSTPLSYRAHRSDNNLVAALGPACNQMRKAFRAHASNAPAPTEEKVMQRFPSIEDFIRAWNQPPLTDARDQIRSTPTDPLGEEFERVRPAFKHVFYFLESVSDAVLAGAVDERLARSAFGASVVSFWPAAAGLLAPPNHRDEWWDPLPRMAELCARWSESTREGS